MRIIHTLAYIVMMITALAFAACDDGGDGNDGGGGTTVDTVVDISAIPGVTPPAYGETPVTTITETSQYTGSVTWSPADDSFDYSTVYTATITLTAKSGYTLTGVSADFFMVAGTDTVSNDADSGVVTAEFPETGIAPPDIIDISAIPGVTPPAYGETPVTTITETSQYTGSVTWSPADDSFDYSTEYTATITLTAKNGYTLTGVSADFFMVAGTDTVSNDADSGVVTAVFPATGAAPDIDVVFQSAVQTGGTSGTADSTALTLTFDVDPTTLTAENIIVTGATKGALSGTGTTRSLAISNITVANGETVSVSITSPVGYLITGSPKTAVVFRFSPDAGYIVTYTADGVLFNLSFVPGGYPFPTVSDDSGTATVNDPYWIAETEVTYELWAKVYGWATGDTDMDGVIETGETAGDYTFAFTSGRVPRAGNDGIPGSETTSQEPVTFVNWRIVMVWCNALTEWYNANNGTSPDFDCVYYTDSGFITPLRAADDSVTIRWDAGSTYSGTEDEPFVNSGADGFRLPTSIEWEHAARWRSDSTNTVAGYSDPWFTQGDSASGATADYNDSMSTGSVAVYSSSYTAPVKSKLANSLGLYDMSGNVWEWCFDWYPGSEGSYRVLRGGGWNYNASYLQVGFWYRSSPYIEYSSYGFRIARSAP